MAGFGAGMAGPSDVRSDGRLYDASGFCRREVASVMSAKRNRGLARDIARPRPCRRRFPKKHGAPLVRPGRVRVRKAEGLADRALTPEPLLRQEHFVDDVDDAVGLVDVGVMTEVPPLSSTMATPLPLATAVMVSPLTVFMRYLPPAALARPSNWPAEILPDTTCAVRTLVSWPLLPGSSSVSTVPAGSLPKAEIGRRKDRERSRTGERVDQAGGGHGRPRPAWCGPANSRHSRRCSCFRTSARRRRSGWRRKRRSRQGRRRARRARRCEVKTWVCSSRNGLRRNMTEGVTAAGRVSFAAHRNVIARQKSPGRAGAFLEGRQPVAGAIAWPRGSRSP